MAKAKGKGFIEHGTVAVNRRARHDYQIEEEIEAGLQLTGSEVKALRLGRCSITEAHAGEKNGELYLMNAHFGEYPAAREPHAPRRPRKLLVHARESKKLLGRAQERGYTLVPLSLYFNSRGVAKLKLGLGRGKRMVDKRETEKQREWKRRKDQLMREKG
jgi:SsrA-binding protein